MSPEQRLRVEGQCLAGMLRFGMSDAEIDLAARLAVQATRALDRARKGAL